MTELRWGDYVIEHDRAATIAAYTKLAAAGASKCNCSVCRNFAAQREKFMTAEVLELFSVLGIDPDYESDLSNYGKDPNAGLYRYAGWYHFVGAILKQGAMQSVGDFSFEFGTAFPKPPKPFQSEPALLAIDFTILLPWVLHEPEPETT